jgi:hypothetical protein
MTPQLLLAAFPRTHLGRISLERIEFLHIRYNKWNLFKIMASPSARSRWMELLECPSLARSETPLALPDFTSLSPSHLTYLFPLYKPQTLSSLRNVVQQVTSLRGQGTCTRFSPESVINTKIEEIMRVYTSKFPGTHKNPCKFHAD